MNNNIFAIILKFFSVLSFVIKDVLIKKLSDNFPTNKIIFFRCLFGLIPVTFMMYLTKSSIKTKKINLPIYRALVVSLAMFAFFKSFHLLPLAEVSILSPIDYSSIIWAITFGIIFFADYPDIFVIIGSLIVVISTYYIIYGERKFGQTINLNKINTRQI